MRKNKIKDIAESVLPASRNMAQSARRDLASAKRNVRRKIRQNLGQVRSADDAVHSTANFTESSDRQVREIMFDRRNADNLGALIRWAQVVERRDLDGLDDTDKYFFFKNLLGDTMQGRHALSHVERALNLQPDPFYLGQFGRVLYNSDEARKLRKMRDRQMRKHLHNQLMGIIESDQHKELNRRLKAVTNPVGHKTNKIDHISPWGAKYYKYEPCADCKYRTFEGLGQIDEYVEYLMRYATSSSFRSLGYGRHAEAFEVVYTFNI